MLKVELVCFCIGVLLVDKYSCDYRRHPNWPKEAEEVCGESYSDRIVGGGFAVLGQYPWIARLVYLDPTTNRTHIFCGGSLVSDLFVVTAAHCLFEDYVLDSVILGEYDERTDPDCDGDFCAEPIQQIKAMRAAHPTYDSILNINDIMVIKLEKPAKLNEWVSPICLPTGSEKFGKSVEVAGWGNTLQIGELSSPVLKRIKIPIVDLDECREAINETMFRETQICAGSKKIANDTCSGDSGGPLMSVYSSNNESGPRYYLTGVVSYGHYVCGIAPAVYTNVTAFMPFVLKAMHTHKTKRKTSCKRKNIDRFQMMELHLPALEDDN